MWNFMKNRVLKQSRLQRRLTSTIFPERAWEQIAHSLRLTRREAQIVRGAFDDRTELAMARDLGISIHTVHTHVERLHRKLGVVDRVSLVLLVVDEFLKLTSSPWSDLPPLCGRRTAGLCHVRD